MQDVVTDMRQLGDAFKAAAHKSNRQLSTIPRALTTLDTARDTKIAKDIALWQASKSDIEKNATELADKLKLLESELASMKTATAARDKSFAAREQATQAALSAAVTSSAGTIQTLLGKSATVLQSRESAYKLALQTHSESLAAVKRGLAQSESDLAASETASAALTAKLTESEASLSASSSNAATLDAALRALTSTRDAMVVRKQEADATIEGYEVAIEQFLTSLTDRMGVLDTMHEGYLTQLKALQADSIASRAGSEAAIRVVRDELANINSERDATELAKHQVESDLAQVQLSMKATAAAHAIETTEHAATIRRLEADIAIAAGMDAEKVALSSSLSELNHEKRKVIAACEAATAAHVKASGELLNQKKGLVGVAKLFYSSVTVYDKGADIKLDDSVPYVDPAGVAAILNAAQSYTPALSDTTDITVYAGKRTAKEIKQRNDLGYVEASDETALLAVRQLSDTAQVMWIRQPPGFKVTAKYKPGAGGFGKYTTQFCVPVATFAQSMAINVDADGSFLSPAKARTSQTVLYRAIERFTPEEFKTKISAQRAELDSIMSTNLRKYDLEYEVATDAELADNTPTGTCTINIILPDTFAFSVPSSKLTARGIQMFNFLMNKAVIESQLTYAGVKISPIGAAGDYFNNPERNKRGANAADVDLKSKMPHKMFWQISDFINAMRDTTNLVEVAPATISSAHRATQFSSYKDNGPEVFSRSVFSYWPRSDGSSPGLAVIAAGASGTGKTTTVIGRIAPDGLTVQSAGAVIETVNKMLTYGATRAEIWVVFIDVYLQQARQLILDTSISGDECKWIPIDFSTPYLILDENSAQRISSESDFLRARSASLDRIRVVRKTELNDESSRSHLFMIFGYSKDDVMHPARKTVLVYADLAGDENTRLSTTQISPAENEYAAAIADKANTSANYSASDRHGAQALKLSFLLKTRTNSIIEAEGAAINADISIMKSILENKPPASGGGVQSCTYNAPGERTHGQKFAEHIPRRTPAVSIAPNERVEYEFTPDDATNPPDVYSIEDRIADIETYEKTHGPVTVTISRAAEQSDIYKLLTRLRVDKLVVLFGMLKLTGASSLGAGITLDFIETAAKGVENKALDTISDAITKFSGNMPTNCSDPVSTIPTDATIATKLDTYRASESIFARIEDGFAALLRKLRTQGFAGADITDDSVSAAIATRNLIYTANVPSAPPASLPAGVASTGAALGVGSTGTAPVLSPQSGAVQPSASLATPVGIGGAIPSMPPAVSTSTPITPVQVVAAPSTAAVPVTGPVGAAPATTSTAGIGSAVQGAIPATIVPNPTSTSAAAVGAPAGAAPGSVGAAPATTSTIDVDSIMTALGINNDSDSSATVSNKIHDLYDIKVVKSSEFAEKFRQLYNDAGNRLLTVKAAVLKQALRKAIERGEVTHGDDGKWHATLKP